MTVSRILERGVCDSHIQSFYISKTSEFEDGTLMYPHLQKFMPPVPSRFVQTRESTQAAISDTYNGDGKVYSALRAAAYVSWEILSFVFTDADW